jgi:hypothetical protein
MPTDLERWVAELENYKSDRKNEQYAVRFSVARRRLLSVAFVLSLLLFAATVALWVFSYQSANWIERRSDKGALQTEWLVKSWDGYVTLGHRCSPLDSRARSPGWDYVAMPSKETLGWPFQFPNDGHWFAGFGRLHESPTKTESITMIAIPDWVFCMSALAVFILALYRLRRRRGHCLTCGYNLTGNISGVCPECGTPSSREWP